MDVARRAQVRGLDRRSDGICVGRAGAHDLGNGADAAEHHALQCGYCTPGMLISATYLLEHNPRPSDEEIRRGIQGNICRCTGYVNIVEAIKAAAR